MWSVVNDSDRVQWHYTPFKNVGPLRFGMSHEESGGLACVVIDALCGPLVSMDGMQLVGRVPSELTDQFHDYQEGRGMSPMISVEGDAASDELGIMVRVQRVGDIRLSRPVFARFDGWAHTVHDCVPRDEWAVR